MSRCSSKPEPKQAPCNYFVGEESSHLREKDSRLNHNDAFAAATLNKSSSKINCGMLTPKEEQDSIPIPIPIPILSFGLVAPKTEQEIAN
ncbi:hypothetical protein GIB67_042506 [Kingdonia uniflora]|uniref:Uncharacterized protein n=1 Tax=Kingdonia uniflora TaxID=39325 RepID=A0A7J7M118_9MAGN|nr:hypothetical protein GIB67_042506 [Kingdonia uniflora]